MANTPIQNLTNLKSPLSIAEENARTNLADADYAGMLITTAIFLGAMTLLIRFCTQFVTAFCTLLYYLVVGCFKALLPCGVLPRKSVEDQVVLVTGSGMGLGRLLAIEFGKLGARLVLWDINEEHNLRTKKLLEEMGVKAYAYTVDLSKKDQIYATAERVKEEVGDVDILINNAGIVVGKKIFDCPDSLMEKTMSINAHSLFYTAKCFLPAMFEKNRGHVVVMASMAGHCGVNGLVDYCASKHAAVGFSDSLRCELRSLGKDIQVTTISPYYINTGMFTGVKTFAPLWFPILEPEYVVYRIMEAILTNEENLYLPRACHLFFFIKGLFPSRAVSIIAEYFGLNHAMDEYVGRSQTISSS